MKNTNTNESTQVLYAPGAGHICTVLKDGRCPYSGKTIPELLAKYPKAEQMTLDEASERITAVNHERYNVGTATKVDRDRFWEMLEVLPPVSWTRRDGAESFKMSEALTGTLTGCFVRIGEEYFELTHHFRTTHDELVKCCQVAA